MKRLIHWKKHENDSGCACGIAQKPIKEGGPIWSVEKSKTTCKDCIESRRVKR